MKLTFQQLIASETPILVDFYADWCAPCKTITPVLEELSSQMGGKVKIIKINVDKNPIISTQYRIQTIPTLILFKKNDIKWRHSGGTTTSQLKKIIHQFI